MATQFPDIVEAMTDTEEWDEEEADAVSRVGPVVFMLLLV